MTQKPTDSDLLPKSLTNDSYTSLVEEKAITRFPTDILLQILSWIHPRKIQKYRRLSHFFNATLQSRHFALLNLSRFIKKEGEEEGISSESVLLTLPHCTSSSHRANELDKLWLAWPPEYQQTYIESRLLKFSVLDWQGTEFTSSFIFDHPQVPPLCLESPLSSCSSLLEAEASFRGSPKVPVLNAFMQLVHLKQLNLSNCNLAGEIPREFGTTMKLLQSLKLDSNGLSGEIPKELGQLKALRLWDLTELEVLCLSGNTLTGELSPLIGKLASLHVLRVSSNRLEGSLPFELGHLVGLEVLWLNDNQLVGGIPASFRNLENLNEVCLTGNCVHLLLPREIEKGSRMWSLLMQNRLPNVVRILVCGAMGFFCLDSLVDVFVGIV
ncbi:hypothetical protein BDR26DRAFT_851567 [Obelidium mucronatum]|nr:hypothetical protein BDR26DRAFT_851567 [Obelidium mucronatum]